MSREIGYLQLISSWGGVNIDILGVNIDFFAMIHYAMGVTMTSNVGTRYIFWVAIVKVQLC